MIFEANIIKLFERNGEVSFWESSNYPQLIESDTFFEQKVQYIHDNPVKKEYVHNAEDWIWSSASKIPGKIRISTH